MGKAQERIGEKIGQYRLKRSIGRGSFGTVYLAENLHEQTQVAIKLLHTPLTTNDNWQSFLNEARSIRLQYPHIIPLLDFGLSHDEIPFLVMEYAPGGTLREHYKRAHHFPLTIVASYTQQIASALQYAHNRRLIHRDVKPENMLLRADGTVVLSDFGIARILEQSSTFTHPTHAGTPAYMAPEQGKGRPSPASDQYSLAVVIYEWIAGRRPFIGTPMEVAIQHQLEPPPALHILCPHIPLQVGQILARALAKKPDERFESVEHFSQELQQAIKNVGIGTTLVRRLPFTSAGSANRQSFTKPILPSLLATNEMEQIAGRQPGAMPLPPTTLATGEVEKITSRHPSAMPLPPTTLATGEVEKITSRQPSVKPLLPTTLTTDSREKITNKFAAISGIDETTQSLPPSTQTSMPSLLNLPSVSSPALSSHINPQPILSPALPSPVKPPQPVALVLPIPQSQTKKAPQHHSMYWRVSAILLLISLLAGGGLWYWSLQAHTTQLPSFASMHTPSTSQSTASTSTPQTPTAIPAKATLTPTAVGGTTPTATIGGATSTATVGVAPSTATVSTSPVSPPPGVPGNWQRVIDDPMTASHHNSPWDLDANQVCTFNAQAYDVNSPNTSNYCPYGDSASSSNTFSDLYYSVDLSILQGNQAGIVFRNVMNDYYYFGITTQREYIFASYPNSTQGYTSIVDEKNSMVINQGSQWNNLAVIARGSSFSFFINEVLVGTAKDLTYSQGIIAVMVNGTGAQGIHTEALFKNAVVWIPKLS